MKQKELTEAEKNKEDLKLILVLGLVAVVFIGSFALVVITLKPDPIQYVNQTNKTNIPGQPYKPDVDVSQVHLNGSG